VEAEAAYLSPEQLDGGLSFVDHLCDLYSLGVVLYVLVTGRPPFQGATAEETFDRIRAGSPVHPRKYQKAIPREFEQTILKTIARNQEDRYQSPDELLVDLTRIAVTYRVTT
jgi:serine/threonine protein kinase